MATRVSSVLGVMGAAMAGLLSASPASATVVTLDGNGFTVSYDDAALGLYGAPALSADGKTIFFTPTAFIANSNDTQGVITTAGSVAMDIHADGGDRVTSLSVLEAGDYQTIYQSHLSPAPSVNVFGEARLTSLGDGTSFVVGSLAHSDLTTVCLSVACTGTDWTASTSVTAPENWGTAGTRFLLQNTLQAASFQNGDSAFIQKKQSSTTIAVQVQTSPVPLPAALPLLVSGMGALGAFARRRRRAA